MTSQHNPGNLLRVIILVASIVCLGPFVHAQSHAVSSAPSEVAVPQRANTLLRDMTTDEKIGQLTQLFYQYFPDTVSFEERIRKGQVGSLSLYH